MEDWTRVVLYGTYDGFTRSTVEPLQIAVRLDGGERVEIPSECVISADQIVKKDEIKLRDVIKRIKDLDIGAREVWFNEILNELGSDYGSAKYKDGYEQGKLEGEWVGQQLKDADKIRQELNKPVIPQFVADWIEEGRKHCKDVSDLFGFDFTNEEVGKWFLQEKPFDLVARAWLDGYTVEKEKRYIVKAKNIGDGWEYLKWNNVQRYWYFGNKKRLDDVRLYHTLEKLQKGGFGNVFVNPLFTIEEVEE